MPTMRNFKSLLVIGLAILSVSAVAQPQSTNGLTSGSTFWSPPVDIGKLTAEAEAGKAHSQLSLAICFYKGQNGVSTNYVTAYKWATLALSGVQSGQADSRPLIKDLEAVMTPQQIAEGKAAAKSFVKKPAANP